MTTAAMSEDERRASTIPAPADLPQCGACGSVLPSNAQWRKWPDLGLEVTECGCGSTVSRVDPAAEHLRDELDDIRDEERAERHREWSGRSW